MKKLFENCKNIFCVYARLRDAICSQRLIRFGLVGLAATASYFALGLLFVDLLSMPLLLGNALAYIISFAVSYAGQSRWTFQSGDADSRMLPRFAIAQAAGFGLNSMIIGALAALRVPYLLSMLAATVSVPFVVYLICKYWVFRPRGKE